MTGGKGKRVSRELRMGGGFATLYSSVQSEQLTASSKREKLKVGFLGK